MSAVSAPPLAPTAAVGDTKLLPFGRKAWEFGRTNPKYDAPINILQGAVRSAKTWSMIPKLHSLCYYPVQGHRIITGVSKQTIYNNVLSDLFDVVGKRNYTYNRSSGELDLLGTKWLVIGAKDEGSEKYVRGLTCAIAYADELTLIPRSFTMMLLNRMSASGARFYATTNPDNPFHYVKTEIIDNEKYREMRYVRTLHFTLNDNPNISEERKQYLRNLYRGVYHLRFIEGLWVVAEGAIYGGSWGDHLLYSDGERKKGVVEEWIACDYGTDHPNVFVHFIDDGDTLWIEREMIWDSRAEMRQKTDKQYADDLQDFLKGAPNAQVIIPPECASFEAELVQRGVWFTTADNEVADGIRVTSSMMALGKLRVHRENCPRTAKGLQAYAWDPKKAERGLEEPIKKNDDEADAVRYGVKTKIAAWRLMTA
jgi:PBSX family phage terminase large subunit